MSRKFPSFTDPSADVALESSDEVLFPVSKAILIMASPFFQTMFTLPQPEHWKLPKADKSRLEHSKGQPGGAGDDGEQKQRVLENGRTVIVMKVSEDSSTLDHLLRIIYPLRSPKFRIEKDEEAQIANNVLAAAIKYDMSFVIQEICSTLLNSALSDSSAATPSPAIRIYAIAYRHGLKEEARDAARACLYGRVHGVYVPELDLINATAYFRLLEYQDNVASKVADFIKTLESVPYEICITSWCSCGSRQGNNQPSITLLGSPHTYSKWWDVFVAKALVLVKAAPLSEDIYSSAVQAAVISTASSCSSCRDSVHGKMHTMERVLRERISELESRVSFVTRDFQRTLQLTSSWLQSIVVRD